MILLSRFLNCSAHDIPITWGNEFGYERGGNTNSGFLRQFTLNQIPNKNSIMHHHRYRSIALPNRNIALYDFLLPLFRVLYFFERDKVKHFLSAVNCFFLCWFLFFSDVHKYLRNIWKILNTWRICKMYGEICEKQRKKYGKVCAGKVIKIILSIPWISNPSIDFIVAHPNTYLMQKTYARWINLPYSKKNV